MAAATVDAGYIAASYSLPEPSIKALLDNPTTEQVKLLLEKIEEKAREYEATQAEKLRSDVELETVVRNGNTRAKQLKDSVDKGLKQVEELRRKLSAEGMSMLFITDVQSPLTFHYRDYSSWCGIGTPDSEIVFVLFDFRITGTPKPNILSGIIKSRCARPSGVEVHSTRQARRRTFCTTTKVRQHASRDVRFGGQSPSCRERFHADEVQGTALARRG